MQGKVSTTTAALMLQHERQPVGQNNRPTFSVTAHMRSRCSSVSCKASVSCAITPLTCRHTSQHSAQAVGAAARHVSIKAGSRRLAQKVSKPQPNKTQQHTIDGARREAALALAACALPVRHARWHQAKAQPPTSAMYCLWCRPVRSSRCTIWFSWTQSYITCNSTPSGPKASHNGWWVDAERGTTWCYTQP